MIDHLMPQVDSMSIPGSSKSKPLVCNFCKKIGHSESVCFAKECSKTRNISNVNFCREKVEVENRDVITAVLSVDVLIDSGSYRG